LLIAGAVVVAGSATWVAVQLLRPVPSMALTASVTTVRALPGAAPGPDWPGRAEAAVGLPGVGLLGAHGGSRPVPIASLAKIMTAEMVLRDRPLPAGGPGRPGGVPGIPHEPAGHRDRQVKCPTPPALPDALADVRVADPQRGPSTVPLGRQPGAGPTVSMVPGGTGPAARKLVMRSCHGFRRS
jgi:hypothetical protein